MITLKCNVYENELKIEKKIKSVEGSLNYIELNFTFDDSWDGLVKTLHAKNPADGQIYTVILEDDKCLIPAEAVANSGTVYFALSGEKDGYRVTTTKSSFLNQDTIYGGTPSQPPTPSQYDQMIEIMRDTQQIAQSVREDADNGVFAGPPGPAGPQGIPGIVIPAQGAFAFRILDNNLHIIYNDADSPPAVYIDGNGHLIFGKGAAKQ